MTTVYVGLGWVVVLAIAFPIVRWWRKDTRQKQEAARQRQVVLQQVGQQQGTVPIADIFGLAQGNHPLPPGFSPAWYPVMRGETLARLRQFERGYLMQHRNWQFLVAEGNETRYYQGASERQTGRMSKTSVSIYKAEQQVRRVTDPIEIGADLVEMATGQDLGVPRLRHMRNVRTRQIKSTYVIALLPSMVPALSIEGWPNQEMHPDAVAAGFVTVPTGYAPFDARFTIHTKDPDFVRTVFGRPFFDHLLNGWQHGQKGMLLMRSNVFKVDCGGELNPATFLPLVEHMAGALDRMGHLG